VSLARIVPRLGHDRFLCNSFELTFFILHGPHVVLITRDINENSAFFRASVHVITTNCVDQDNATGSEICRLLKEFPLFTETENSLP